MTKYFSILLLLIITGIHGLAQPNMKWWNPLEQPGTYIGGRLPDCCPGFNRLPSVASTSVRPDVWTLSQNSAGEYLEFTTNASEIVVRYQLKHQTNLPNMAKLGVAGVDMYLKDGNGWHWTKMKYSFGDTVVFKAQHLPQQVSVSVFRLYLPLYDAPLWLQVGVDSAHSLKPQLANSQKPVIIYGTSILQGASSSRPGLAFANILGRNLSVPIVNLGFSGNGQLEQSVIGQFAQVAASAIILDCLPNLHDEERFSNKEIEQRILDAVKQIKDAQLLTPLLLVEHSCGLPAFQTDTLQQKRYLRVNAIQALAWQKLKRIGYQKIYLLKASEIGITAEDTIDGTHPGDAGMQHYAEAYRKRLTKMGVR